MISSRIDWVVMWKLFHVQFFWIYLALGIPIRFVAVRRFGAASSRKTGVSVVVASFASSVFGTWLPIAPIFGVGWTPVRPFGENCCRRVSSNRCAPSRHLNGNRNRVSRQVLFRMLLKESVKKRSCHCLSRTSSTRQLLLHLGWHGHSIICQPLSQMLTVGVNRRFRELRTAGEAKLPL